MDKEKEIHVVDLTEVFEPYHNKWVALSPDEKKVMGSGKSPKQALKESIERGEKDPILTKVPKDYASYIL
jgi:hypothetical protein